MSKILRMVFIALLVLFHVAALSACSSGGGGIIGTGVVTGKITGFGSIIVDGIEFTRRADLQDNRVTFRFDDTAHAEHDLKAGMIVTIKGNFNSNTSKGVYERIEYQPELRGPIDAAPGSVDVANETLTVLGRTVKVDDFTIFDGCANLSELQPDNLVEVSGNLDSTGVFLATRVERKATSFGAGGVVEVKGVITGVGATFFRIGTLTVNFDPTLPNLFANMTAADVTVATLVEVSGILRDDGSVTANKIEKKTPTEDEQINDTVRVKGSVITASPSNFQLSGPNGPVTVLSGNAIFVKGTPANLVAGANLEVEGVVAADGILAATKISFETENIIILEGNIAQATDIDQSNGTITLNGVTVLTNSLTRFRDNRTVPAGPSPTFGLNEITAQDHLQIVGFVDTAGMVTASQLERFDASNRTFIQGIVSAIFSPSFTILNITIVTSTVGTSFLDASNHTISQAAFFSALTPNTSVVKASGTVLPSGSINPATTVKIQP